VIFVGIDWAEAHHDVCVLDQQGRVPAKGRVAEGVEGLGRLHAMVAEHAEEPTEVVVGIELDRGLLVGSLVEAGYHVYAVNPFAVSRYRDRHQTSGAKSDPGDAKVLADLVRTDRHNHREVAGDTDLAEAIKVLARAHQSLVWTRQRQVNQLRSTLREFYPGALVALRGDLASHEACSLLGMAPTPERGRRLTRSRIRRSLAASGRTRNLDRRAEQIYEALHAPQLEAPPVLAEAYGQVVGSLVVVIDRLTHQIGELERELAERFEGHPDAEIVRSLPGLGLILGARCSRSSGTTRPATKMLEPGAATREAPRSPGPRGPGSWCWPAWHATAGSPTPATCGPSPRSGSHRVLVATTTPGELVGPPTIKRCERSPTDSSAYSTGASDIDAPTSRVSLGPVRSKPWLDVFAAWDV
jgi:transposase